jgi:hypothetical protein
MSPRLIRAVFSILVVRAIFLSPVQGSEFGHSSRLIDSSLKRTDAIRPSRLRFTNPGRPSPAFERLDCIDGGDGNDDDRIRPASISHETWRSVDSLGSRCSNPRPLTTAPPGFVPLRC